jgi:protein SCO1/2
MRLIRLVRGLMVLTALLLPLSATAQTAQEAPPPAGEPEHHHEHHQPPAAPPDTSATQKVDLKIPDLALVDQDGKPVRFYTDLVRGKVVMINFIFTSCTTICPPMGATFGKVQELLGDRAGKDVHLISVSVDPATDTPQRMKAWGKKFGAAPGWTLVTGDRETVVQLLKGLGVYTPNINDHTPLVLAGNDHHDEWTRAYGLAAPAQLVDLIDSLATPTAASHGAHKETQK